MPNGTGWSEEYLNEEGKRDPKGSPEEENRFFEKISEEIQAVVRHFEKDNGRPLRANHAKILAGIVGAEFRVSLNIPSDLAVGFLSEPGKVYKANVRFSNASGEFKTNDAAPDLRGAAIRVLTDRGDHDFLMTNAEPHHAVDAREAMVAITAGTKKDSVEDAIPDLGPIRDKIAGLLGAFPHLVAHLGLHSAQRIAGTLKTQMNRKVMSLESETYWSRAPIAIGKVSDPEQSVAVKYRLAPVLDTPAQPEDNPKDGLDLGQKLKDRIRQDEVTFNFQVQRYVDPATTPIEDATVRWPSTFETIAELVIPKGAEINDNLIDGLDFSPWNVDLSSFRPLGSMNRARKSVYRASASLRHPGGQGGE
jgi:hypothetical protein